MKEGRGKFGYFNSYLVDTDHAVIMDVEATRLAWHRRSSPPKRC
jgi:hypothetical protein